MRLRSSGMVAALIAGAGALAGPAHALQVVEGRDGVAVEAILSIKEPTRIRIDGAPITDVFGNIYSSSCGVAALAGTGGASPSGVTRVIYHAAPGRRRVDQSNRKLRCLCHGATPRRER